jgi:hypothetical protein
MSSNLGFLPETNILVALRVFVSEKVKNQALTVQLAPNKEEIYNNFVKNLNV